MPRRFVWFFIIITLLIGFGLRLNGLGQMNSAILYDEAAYGVDALSLLQNPRLTPYFESNNGREGLWMYVTAPALALWGAQPFSLRIMAVFAGMLTLAATYRLGREGIGARNALWVLAAMAVFYWPVHLGHIGFRAALYPLIGAATFAALLNAYRTQRLSRWTLAGCLLGLLLYTYIAARVWVALGVLLLLWWLIQSQQRRGAALALIVAVIIMLPLGIYLLTSDASSTRTTQVAVESVEAFTDNLGLWLRAWFDQGDSYMTHNAPNRPIFDLPTGLLAIVGLIGLWRFARRWHIGLLIVLFLSALAPALLSVDNPHMLRSYGAVVPLAILIGSGAAWIAHTVPRIGYVVAVGLVVWAAINSDVTFAQVAANWDAFLPGEYRTLAAIDYLAENDLVPPGRPIAFTPFDHDYPVMHFKAGDLGEHRLLAYRPGYCTVYDANQPMLTVLIGDDMDADQQLIAQSGTVERLYTDAEDRFALTEAQIEPALMAISPITFGDQITLNAQISQGQAQPGDTITVNLALQAQQALTVDYNAFVQLWGTPSPLEGGRLWAQHDLRLCEPYPTQVWQANDVIVQTWSLTLPEDTPPGLYQVVAGVYNPQSNTRLQRTDGSDVVVLGDVSVQR